MRKKHKKEIKPEEKTETKSSSFKDFIKRPVASKDEIKKFEDNVKHEYREEQIEENLNTIYKDKKGRLIDVSRLNIKGKKSWWQKLMRLFFILLFLAGLAFGAYWYFFQYNFESQTLQFSVDAPESVVAGQEFVYTIKYANPSNIDLNNLNIEVVYPENFVFLDSSKPSKERNALWEIPMLKAGETGQIAVKGKIFARVGSPNTIKLSASYMPENFSSYFKEEIFATTLIDSLGFALELDYANTALVGKEQEAKLEFSLEEERYLNNLDLVFSLPENIEVTEPENIEPEEGEKASSTLVISSKERYTWHLEGLGQENIEQALTFNYLVKDKLSDEQSFVLSLYHRENNQNYLLFEKSIDLKVMKSDLNLTLIVNGSKSGEPVNFGEELNYLVAFDNQGELAIEDVTVMVVIDSNLLDWEELKDENEGEYNNNTIAWSKEHIPALAEISPGQEGVINFSLPIKDFELEDLDKSLEVESYAQFSFKSEEEDISLDNRSNTVVNLLNSDLKLEEKVLYFTEDNLPVGSGPLPPKVNQTTKFRGYWQISNNVHDLGQVRVELKLPTYINFEEAISATKGLLKYDDQSRVLSWEIETVKKSDYLLEAEFYLTLTPTADDYDKILVISPGASLSALDLVTEEVITKKSEATTTKLEEDEIANLSSDGRVEN
ncbi:MAG: DUF11 domain-containing protein [Candidatus Pacebacteria bacterium]|nr:DUF11 domain-containing protein [Candidatus Paceibacterota bacterium]